ncbi:MAG: hypothetical protein HY298_18090 [Verrucomicrobia bacterium]|nr:hypothetical protein [Verrucomicrobiota bacterium]
MNPYKRAALLLIRLVASGFILFGLLDLGVYVLKHFLHKADWQVMRCLLSGVPVVIGLVILIKSPAIAARLTQDFDE